MSQINAVLLDFRELGGDASFFDTNSYSPAANQTVILVTSGVGQVSPVPIIPGVSGNGLTWSLVASQQFDWAGVNRGRVTVYRGLSAAPSVGVTRVQYASTLFQQAITVFQFTQTDIGNLGANAIVGTPVQVKEPTGSGTNPSLNVPAGEDSENAQIGIFAYSDPSMLIIPGIGFVTLKNNPTGEGGGHYTEMSQIVLDPVDFILNNDTAVRAMIAIELRNATPSGAAAGAQAGGRPSFVTGNLIT